MKGLYAEAIRAINHSGKPVIAVDIPSGAESDSMHPQSGEGIARADAIVTFTAPRPAHVFGVAHTRAGCTGPHRQSRRGDCLVAQSGSDSRARSVAPAGAAPPGFEQGNVWPCADSRRLTGQVGRCGDGGNGGAARRRGAEYRRGSSQRAAERGYFRCRVDDRAVAGDQERWHRHGGPGRRGSACEFA